MSDDKPSVKLAMATIAVLASILTIGLLSGWVRTEENYLPPPSWYTGNKFSWHPINMVCFFVSQVLAISSWTILTPYLGKTQALCVHLVFMFCGLIFMFAGFAAIVQSKNDDETNGVYYSHLRSMHSWAGITCICIFICNFLLGIAKHFIGPSLEKTNIIFLLHRFLGISALVLAAVAIISGINEILEECNAVVPEEETNPAEYYGDIPGGCKIGLGMGTTVLLSLVCLLFLVMLRLAFNFDRVDDGTGVALNPK